MYIQTKTNQELISTLSDNIGKDFVIHYNCLSCDDEQVSETNEIEQSTIDEFISHDNTFFVRLECTVCSHATLFLTIEKNIQGIEILEP